MISKVKSNAIEEILSLWKSKERNSKKCIEDFENDIDELNWEIIGRGSFKACVGKKSIIAKYSMTPNDEKHNSEVIREFEQWQRVPSGFKKYLPKVYGLFNGLLIQDRVLCKCSDLWRCKKVKELSIKFPLQDQYSNHGHNMAGTVKFFDWIYNRQWAISENRELDFMYNVSKIKNY